MGEQLASCISIVSIYLICEVTDGPGRQPNETFTVLDEARGVTLPRLASDLRQNLSVQGRLWSLPLRADQSKFKNLLSDRSIVHRLLVGILLQNRGCGISK